MKAITYVGPFDAVEIETAPALLRTVQQGETVSVADPLAESLLEQTDNWSPAKASKTKTPIAEEA